MKPVDTKSENWNFLYKEWKLEFFTLCFINLNMASISGMGKVQSIFNLDPCVMKHLWSDIVDSSINLQNKILLLLLLLLPTYFSWCCSYSSSSSYYSSSSSSPPPLSSSSPSFPPPPSFPPLLLLLCLLLLLLILLLLLLLLLFFYFYLHNDHWECILNSTHTDLEGQGKSGKWKFVGESQGNYLVW